MLSDPILSSPNPFYETLLAPFFADNPRIWIQGNTALLSQLPHNGLAIVGTRLPTLRSIDWVEQTILGLKDRNLVIVSGLARGIDAAAHVAALKAGLPTVAILGCGLDHTYPPEHTRLRAQILEAGGAIISEFEPSLPARAHYFLKRNRLIAGWSRATWVVEAPGRSGTLNTAAWARSIRDVTQLPIFQNPRRG